MLRVSRLSSSNTCCVLRVLGVAGRGPESGHAYRHVRQPLADVVVQIARDVGARGFLRVNQAAGHLFDALITRQ